MMECSIGAAQSRGAPGSLSTLGQSCVGSRLRNWVQEMEPQLCCAVVEICNVPQEALCQSLDSQLVQFPSHGNVKTM